MWISTRNYFKRGDPGWENYIEFIQIPGLVEVRSIDSMLNDFVEDSGAVPCEREDVFEMIRELPPVSSGAYYQLAVNLREESARAASPGWNLLGYDLSWMRRDIGFSKLEIRNPTSTPFFNLPRTTSFRHSPIPRTPTRTHHRPVLKY